MSRLFHIFEVSMDYDSGLCRIVYNYLIYI